MGSVSGHTVCRAGDGFVTKQEFKQLYQRVFPAATPDIVERAFQTLDLEGRGQVDIISWTHRIRLQDMPRMVELIRKQGKGGGGGWDKGPGRQQQ
jgi:hypothetical protein